MIKLMKKPVVAIILVVLAFVLLLCCAVSGIGLWIWLNNEELTNGPEPTSEEITIPESTEEEEDPELAMGFITGSLSFPSEEIPENLVVCAKKINATEEYCTTKHLDDPSFTYGVGYELEVSPGTYNVFAFDLNGDPEYRAYYTEFVTCGLSVDCPSHEYIPVTVVAGETTSGIDPGDWYDF